MGDEKPSMDYRPSKSVLRWVAVGLAVSTAVVIIISLFSGVTLSDLARLGYWTFGLAAATSVARLLVQIVRFRVIAKGLGGDPKLDLSGSAIARMSSEFIAISTPSEVGGPVLRAAWLSRRGVDGGKALWIGYFEVIMEIYVGAGLGLIAAGYALSRGATILALTIAVIAVTLIVGYTLVFVVPALRSIKVPNRLFTLASFLLGGPRAKSLYLRAVVGSLNFSVAARAIINRNTLPVVIKTVGLVILEDFLEGVGLWLVLNAAGLKIDIFSATFVAFGALTIAAIPISIGGSGLTELSMQSYLSLVYGFSSWAAVVLWRITTYQVQLVITGIVFMFFVRKATGGSNQTSQKTGSDPSASEAPGLTAAEVEKEIVKLDTRYTVVKTSRFAIAGAVGFGVTAIILTSGLTVFYGKLSFQHASFALPALLGLDVLSLVIGASASFFINERITVHVPKTLKSEVANRFVRFLKFQAVIGVGNIGVLVVQLVLLATLEVTPLLGMITGAAVIYPIVYFVSIKYVWKAHRTR
ncbi:MAG: flippase-like domain-containing protein [Thaumarchaeota archaeon]|nr:flippase-like domain-containing protein [Nitrososphaerota archaeon]